MGYTISKHKHGIVVEGRAVPLSDLIALSELWEVAYGYTLLDTLIAKHIGVILVATDKEHSELWRQELGIAPKVVQGTCIEGAVTDEERVACECSNCRYFTHEKGKCKPSCIYWHGEEDE